METRYCIEYINPQYPLCDDGSLNIRYDRVLTLEQAEHDLTFILSFGGKILNLYMGNVVDGETGEWSPKPMIINNDDWFSTKWLNTLGVKEVDLEKEVENLIEKEKAFVTDDRKVKYYNGDSFNHIYELEFIAKYFFELGLKTKGE